MADDTVKVARHLAIAHIIVGFAMLGFGIADRVVVGDIGVSFYDFGIWIGVWAAVYMGFSITSTVFSGLIITVYSVSLASLSDYHSGYRYSGEGVYDTKLALSAITLILGIAEFATGLCAVICCCLMKPCTCSVYCCMTLHKQKGTQVLCTTNTAGYVMTQGPGGVPVAVPIQATCAQGGQAPMVMVPGPGAAGGQQPLVVHAGPTGAIPGTGHTPQETEIPSYGHGQYLPLNEPVSD